MTIPTADQPVSFAEHIKPLFRPTDRDSMAFAFDLWDVAEVRSNADAILSRLQQGGMPCDDRWPSEDVDLVARWIAMGKVE